MFVMPDVTMPEKMRILNGLARRKGWVLSLSTLLKVLNNKMTLLKFATVFK